MKDHLKAQFINDLKLCAIRFHDFGSLRIQLSDIVRPLFDEVDQIQRERDELKALAEERRQFIVNSVYLGYCSLPDESINDPANDTYRRCNLEDWAAINDLQAKAVEDAAKSVVISYDSSGMGQGEEALHVAYLYDKALEKYAANLRTNNTPEILPGTKAALDGLSVVKGGE